MTLFDTDTFSLFVSGQARVVERVRPAQGDFAITIITRIEVLRGRFDSVVKAADAGELQRAQQRLDRTDQDLARVTIIPFDAAALGEFDKLRQNKKLKKIGRADLLIASITLAQPATLVSRNLRHFQQVPGLRVENWAD
jgi:tRNA(fMet)-specific endonuclease VapC